MCVCMCHPPDRTRDVTSDLRLGIKLLLLNRNSITLIMHSEREKDRKKRETEPLAFHFHTPPFSCSLSLYPPFLPSVSLTLIQQGLHQSLSLHQATLISQDVRKHKHLSGNDDYHYGRDDEAQRRGDTISTLMNCR